MALLSTTTLRTDYLPDVSSVDSDAISVLGRALQRAEDLVSRHLGYPGASPSWASATHTLRLQARRSDPTRLLLPVAPVASITSVYQDLEMSFGASSLVSSSDYELETLRNGAYLHVLPTATGLGAWYTVDRTIKVTLVGGYANEAAIPDDLTHAVYGWVADWWMRRRVRSLASSSQGGSSQNMADLATIPADVQDILADYVLISHLGGLS